MLLAGEIVDLYQRTSDLISLEYEIVVLLQLEKATLAYERAYQSFTCETESSEFF